MTDLFASPKSHRHPKCKGYSVSTDWGPEYDCGHGTTITCDECRYCEGNRGRGKDPAAKCNQPR